MSNSKNNSKIDIKEVFRYGIAGITVTIINLGIYNIGLFFGLKYSWANLIALVFARVYAFLVNKLFVYRTKCKSYKGLFIEIIGFVIVRGFTGLIDFLGVIVFVEFFGINEKISKYILVGIVIISNYILGRFVFNKSINESQ